MQVSQVPKVVNKTIQKKLDLNFDFTRVYPSLPDFTKFDRVNSSQTCQTFRFYQKSSLLPS